MRIAVDARPLATPHNGIGRYTQSLLEAMVESGHQWCLYSDRPLDVALPKSSRLWLRRGSAPGGTVASLWWSQMQFARWAVQDVVDLFWSPRHHLPLLLNKRIASVVTIHDLVWCRMPDTMQRGNLMAEKLLMGPSIRKADQVICVSRFTASEVSRYYPAAMGKCKVVSAAAQEHSVTGQLPPGIPDKYLLFVGTLEPRKNLPRLLRAYAMVKDDREMPPLVIVGGSGWGDEDIPGLVANLDLQSRVVMTGQVTDAELQALYAGALCLLMPSLYEGFGLPVLEAMRHGVPVIASSTGALPEVAGSAGMLVNPFSEAEIVSAIRQVVHEPELRNSLSRKALAREESFSWQQAADETLALFQRTLADHEPRAYRHRALHNADN